MTADH